MYIYIYIHIFTYIYYIVIYTAYTHIKHTHTDSHYIINLSTHTYFYLHLISFYPWPTLPTTPGLVHSVDTLDENYGILSKLWSLRDGRAGGGFSTNVTFSVSVFFFSLWQKKPIYVLGGCQKPW